MVGKDIKNITRCYDLKGSILGRETELTEAEKSTGETGLKVLKDINFKEE